VERQIAETVKRILFFLLSLLFSLSGPAMEANGDFGCCSLAKAGTKIIGNNLPKVLTDIKNAKGEVFKSVHTPPSTPHPRMDFHTHPNYRNVLPDRTKRVWPSLLIQTGTHRPPWRLSEFDDVSFTIRSSLDSSLNSLK